MTNFEYQITYPSVAEIADTVQELNEIMQANGAEEDYQARWTGAVYSPDRGDTWWFQASTGDPEPYTCWVLMNEPVRGSFETFAEIEGVTLASLGL